MINFIRNRNLELILIWQSSSSCIPILKDCFGVYGKPESKAIEAFLDIGNSDSLQKVLSDKSRYWVPTYLLIALDWLAWSWIFLVLVSLLIFHDYDVRALKCLIYFNFRFTLVSFLWITLIKDYHEILGLIGIVFSKNFKFLVNAHKLFAFNQLYIDFSLAVYLRPEESVIAVSSPHFCNFAWSLSQFFETWWLWGVIPVFEYEFEFSDLRVFFIISRTVTVKCGCNSESIFFGKFEFVKSQLVCVTLLQNDIVRSIAENYDLIDRKGKPYSE